MKSLCLGLHSTLVNITLPQIELKASSLGVHRSVLLKLKLLAAGCGRAAHWTSKEGHAGSSPAGLRAGQGLLGQCVVGQARQSPQCKGGRGVVFLVSGPKDSVRAQGIDKALLPAACGHIKMWFSAGGVLTAAQGLLLLVSLSFFFFFF